MWKRALISTVWLLALAGCWTFSEAQDYRRQVPLTTSYTRSLLEATNSQHAREILGTIGGTNSATFDTAQFTVTDTNVVHFKNGWLATNGTVRGVLLVDWGNSSAPGIADYANTDSGIILKSGGMQVIDDTVKILDISEGPVNANWYFGSGDNVPFNLTYRTQTNTHFKQNIVNGGATQWVWAYTNDGSGGLNLNLEAWPNGSYGDTVLQVKPSSIYPATLNRRLGVAAGVTNYPSIANKDDVDTGVNFSTTTVSLQSNGGSGVSVDQSGTTSTIGLGNVMMPGLLQLHSQTNTQFRVNAINGTGKNWDLVFTNSGSGVFDLNLERWSGGSYQDTPLSIPHSSSGIVDWNRKLSLLAGATNAPSLANRADLDTGFNVSGTQAGLISAGHATLTGAHGSVVDVVMGNPAVPLEISQVIQTNTHVRTSIINGTQTEWAMVYTNDGAGDLNFELQAYSSGSYSHTPIKIGQSGLGIIQFNRRLQMTSGTSANPSIANLADPDTGINFNGDNIVLYSAGSSVLDAEHAATVSFDIGNSSVPLEITQTGQTNTHTLTSIVNGTSQNWVQSYTNNGAGQLDYKLITTTGATHQDEALKIPWATSSAAVLERPLTVGGVINAPDGSASAPAYSFSSDTDVGMYYQASPPGILFGVASGAQVAKMTSGNLALGQGTGQVLLLVDGGAGSDRGIRLRSGTSGSDNRWQISANSTAEGGSDAGSDLEVIAQSDAGATIDRPIKITRAAGGTIEFQRPINFATSLQTLSAGNAVAATDTRARVVGNGGAVTLTSTPTIADGGGDGQMLYVFGTNDSNTVALQDETALAGSNLQLGVSTNRTLGLGDVLVLMWDSTSSSWYEVSFTNN